MRWMCEKWNYCIIDTRGSFNIGTLNNGEMNTEQSHGKHEYVLQYSQWTTKSFIEHPLIGLWIHWINEKNSMKHIQHFFSPSVSLASFNKSDRVASIWKWEQCQQVSTYRALVQVAMRVLHTHCTRTVAKFSFSFQCMGSILWDMDIVHWSYVIYIGGGPWHIPKQWMNTMDKCNLQLTRQPWQIHVNFNGKFISTSPI